MSAISPRRRRGLLQTIIEGAAERIALQAWVPAENREAMRATAVSIIEQQFCAVLGADSIKISGWVVPPSQRMSQRDRIEAALRSGEPVNAIAGRELVSPQWVRRVRAELQSAKQIPPEQFRSVSPK